MIDRIPRNFNSMKQMDNIKPRSDNEVFRPVTLDQAIVHISDTFGLIQFTSEDLTPQGKVPLIISSDSKESVDSFKCSIADSFAPQEASVKEDLDFVSSVKVEVDPYNFDRLMKTLPHGARVTIDSKIRFPRPIRMEESSMRGIAEARPEVDQLNSTTQINKLWEQGYTGKGVGICVIDSGLYPHPDFEGRVNKFIDFHKGSSELIDPYGHGTLVTSVAAGTGKASEGKFRGFAPGADIIALRITSVAEAIKAIQWATENKDEHNIRVMNISLGDYAIKSYKDDPWAQACEKAWDAGIAVIAASGNEGPGQGTISTPGTHPKIITVGYFDDRSTPERDDDIIPSQTSRGPTSPDNIQKPDVVAPGVMIYGALSPKSALDSKSNPRYGNNYVAHTGSSMATPMVSGLAALLLEANPDLTPDELKEIIVSTADSYLPNAGVNDQGAGVLDPVESLQVALGRRKPRVEGDSGGSEVPMHIAQNNDVSHSNSGQTDFQV